MVYQAARGNGFEGSSFGLPLDTGAMPEKIGFNIGTLGVTNIGARFRRMNHLSLPPIESQQGPIRATACKQAVARFTVASSDSRPRPPLIAHGDVSNRRDGDRDAQCDQRTARLRS